MPCERGERVLDCQRSAEWASCKWVANTPLAVKCLSLVAIFIDKMQETIMDCSAPLDIRRSAANMYVLPQNHLLFMLWMLLPIVVRNIHAFRHTDKHSMVRDPCYLPIFASGKCHPDITCQITILASLHTASDLNIWPICAFRTSDTFLMPGNLSKNICSTYMIHFRMWMLYNLTCIL